MIKIILSLALVVTLISVLSALVPVAFLTGMDNAIIYFLSAFNNLSFIVDPSVIFACLRVILNVLLFNAIFKTARGFTHLVLK